jgi:hypothetical protein
VTVKPAIMAVRSPSVALDLPKPEWVSLNQAFLMVAEGWPPISEEIFRAIEGLPLPDRPDAKRLLVPALAYNQIRHKGELRQIRSGTAGGSCVGSSDQSFKIKDLYVAPPQYWDVREICFHESTLHLDGAPEDVKVDPLQGDFFEVVRILACVEDVEKLCGSAQPKAAGGRPPKSTSLIKIGAQAGVFIHREGVPDKRSSLVAALQTYQEDELPEDERLGKTTIEAIAREHIRQIQFDDE